MRTNIKALAAALAIMIGSATVTPAFSNTVAGAPTTSIVEKGTPVKHETKAERKAKREQKRKAHQLKKEQQQKTAPKTTGTKTGK